MNHWVWHIGLMNKKVAATSKLYLNSCEAGIWILKWSYKAKSRSHNLFAIKNNRPARKIAFYQFSLQNALTMHVIDRT